MTDVATAERAPSREDIALGKADDEEASTLPGHGKDFLGFLFSLRPHQHSNYIAATLYVSLVSVGYGRRWTDQT